MPSSRATSISGLVSIVKVTRPSTSAGVEPGVVERGDARLDGELQLAAAGVLGELGRADADDRRLAGVGVLTVSSGTAHRELQLDRAGDVVAELVARLYGDHEPAGRRRRRSAPMPVNVIVS